MRTQERAFVIEALTEVLIVLITFCFPTLLGLKIPTPSDVHVHHLIPQHLFYWAIDAMKLKR